MRWRERLAALDEAQLMAAIDRHRLAGEATLEATLLALVELLGDVPADSAARELGVERALVLRAISGLQARGRWPST
ncbi:hypothetical protein [Modicisalibacter radicis]|uniref:hypothetical protein n=1 Tax=Halomonas sp. EAR18 TaxID=2518972 RepID=UPI00109C08FF|nr:hypothetical protein [Halomonas sp. EAR18]